jgi:hypothetical protein
VEGFLWLLSSVLSFYQGDFVKQIRRHLTYANVMSSIAVFLILGGATAMAAKVGTGQLKAGAVKTGKLAKEAVKAGKLAKNAVTTPKIANAAVTTDKIADGAVSTGKIADNAVNGSKIADGSVSGADINAGSTSFSRVVAQIRGNVQVPATAGTVYPFNNSTYTQNASEDNQFIGAVDVTFAASCNQPRSATAYLLIDSANPAAPDLTNELAGLATVTDKGTGTVSRRAEFVPIGGFTGMSRFAPNANTLHTFSVFVASSNCNTGSGVTIAGAGVDVIGTK